MEPELGSESDCIYCRMKIIYTKKTFGNGWVHKAPFQWSDDYEHCRLTTASPNPISTYIHNT